VFVPRPQNRALHALRRIGSDQPDASPPKEPRFAVRVCWGANYEPWVADARLLTAASASRCLTDFSQDFIWFHGSRFQQIERGANRGT
jgi:hypothetical protein